MAPTTNNRPCAQHTETSGGRSGHTSRTVTVSMFVDLNYMKKLVLRVHERTQVACCYYCN